MAYRAAESPGETVWRSGRMLGVMRDDSVLVRLALKRLSAGNLEKLVGALENEKNEARRCCVSAGCEAR